MKPVAVLTRREFIKVTTTASAGLVLGFRLRTDARPEQSVVETETVFTPNAWLRIDKSGAVIVTVAKSEMGQGVLTSLPMIVAEELDADWTMVRSEQAMAEKKYGSMGTGGSASVRTSWDTLRRAGATARQMLVSAAAATWGVSALTCTTERGVVHHATSGRSLRYGALVEKAAMLAVPEHVMLKDPKDFRIIGKRTRRLDTPLKVNGSGKFGIDTRVPGMLYATVIHSPVFGGKVKSIDASKAKAIHGVRDVAQIATGIAIIADSTWLAFQGREALNVVWDEGMNGHANSASIAQSLVEAGTRGGVLAEKEGDTDTTLASAAKKLEAVYEAPYLAHAPMEPMNCTADVRDGVCEVWAPTQTPTGVQHTAASVLGINQDKVTVHTTLLGGGFGRRMDSDFVIDAVLCSKAARAPVKMTWTREEDIQQDGYRPVSRHQLAGALDGQGRLIALHHKVIAPSIGDQRRPGSLKDGLDKGAVEGAVNLPYAIPNLLVEFVLAPTPVPIWYWRSVYPSQNVFALECFIDELAASAGKDPYDFRLALTEKSPRARGVLKLAAAKAGWGSPLPAGHFRGIACTPPAFFGSYVAQVVEISLSAEKRIRVHRVVCAIDCGIAVNPDTIEAQVEGSIVYGLTAALKGEITIDKGRVMQQNFDDYPLLTIDEMPKVEVHIMPSAEPPTGTGEPALPPIAPAVANALFGAVGKRIRRMPFRLQS